MPWIMLGVAGLLEVCWAVGLKYTEGFTRLVPSLFVGAGVLASVFLLSLATRHLPVGTAYAVWVGIGALGAAIGEVLFLGGRLTPSTAFFLALLVVAIVGLKATHA